LEELRVALAQTQTQSVTSNDALIAKIKKKYEKKLAQAKIESEEAREELYFEQQLLLESLMEQRRDMRLLELICEAVVPSTELKNVSP
jgi:hypothetical protein